MDITEDQNKWKNMLCPCVRKHSIVERILLRLNLLCISSKNTNVIFSGHWQDDFKVYLED